MNCKKLTALLLALALAFALAACGGPAANSSEAPSEAPGEGQSEAPSEAPSQAPSEEPSAAPSEDVHVEQAIPRLAVLSGPTGIGAAKMLSVPDENAQGYEYTIETDNNALVAGLTGPEPAYDIATMASNAAVTLYNKNDGGVKIIALGTLGVLHILESGGGTSINSVADLAGKTVWSAGQGANPEYILRHLLEENGLIPGENVEIVFGDASEIQAKLLSGEIECAMLPVPAATAAIAKSEGQVRDAVDVTEAWNELDGGSLVMTAVVVRTEFLETYPDAVADFLKDYAASIEYVNGNVDEAAQMVADLGITPSAGIAKAAIPQCHLTFIAGADMKPAISGYFETLNAMDPTSIGGKLPDDAIYYVP